MLRKCFSHTLFYFIHGHGSNDKVKGKRVKVLSYLQSLNLQAIHLEAFCSSGEVDKMIEQCLNSALQTSQRKPYVNGPVDSL